MEPARSPPSCEPWCGRWALAAVARHGISKRVY